MPTWFVGARLVIEGMPVCARGCSRGSSRAGGDQGVLLGLQSTSEDCEMELTWLPMAAGCPRRSQVWPLGFAGQKPLSLGISTCGRSCHGGKAFLIPAGAELDHTQHLLLKEPFSSLALSTVAFCSCGHKEILILV